jgi:tripartite-type tricarboxylate transporter receptor subunit TctC
MTSKARKVAVTISTVVGLLTSFPLKAISVPVDVAGFYSGHVVTIVVGSSTGGGYDLNARLLAKYLGKYIPGSPTVIVENMPGAGGLKAAGYMYSVAPKDGSYIAILQRNLTVEPLFTKQIYDGTKFTWLGSVSGDVSLCLSSSASKASSLADLKKEKFVLASQAPGADSQIFGSLLKNFVDANIKMISGYPGTSDMALAMDRGEVDGMCGISRSTLTTLFDRALKQKSINVLVQAAVQRDPAMADVPTFLELATTDMDRAAIKLLTGTQPMARPFVAPPDIPADRKDALRVAFEQATRDPQFLADAKQSNVDVTPISGEAIDRILSDLYHSAPEVIKRAAQVTAP